jgi:hypothetical protein
MREYLPKSVVASPNVSIAERMNARVLTYVRDTAFTGVPLDLSADMVALGPRLDKTSTLHYGIKLYFSPKGHG